MKIICFLIIETMKFKNDFPMKDIKTFLDAVEGEIFNASFLSGIENPAWRKINFPRNFPLVPVEHEKFHPKMIPTTLMLQRKLHFLLFQAWLKSLKNF